MSGSVLPTITHVGAQSLYGTGSSSTVSSFQTASVSSLTVSTMTAGSVTAASVSSAIDRSAVFYTSSLSGTAPTATSTLLFTVGDGAGGGGGTYAANINLITSAVNSAPASAIFTVGLSGNGTVAAVNPLANNSSATYDISAFASTSFVKVYLANTGGLSPPYLGTFTRIGF